MKLVLFLVILVGALILGWYHSTHTSLNPELLRRANQEYTIRRGQIGNRKILTIIDYRLDISQPRLFVYDMNTRRVILRVRVSHALKSGIIRPTVFSNEVGSEKSCSGIFLTQQHIYQGRFGKALRLVGISPGINDQSEARAIVFHEDPGYQYSKGCFMTSAAVNDHLVTLLQGRSLVVVYK